jgi:CBS domain-containing protein
MTMAIDTAISRIMTTEVVTVGLETAVPEVAKVLWEHQISGVPVVKDRKVLGMVTEFDLISTDIEYQAPLFITFLDAYFELPGTAHKDQLRRILAITAADLMTKPALTVHPDATVQEVVTLMYKHRVNPVPVVNDQNELVGIVSRSDVIHLMVVEEERHDG